MGKDATEILLSKSSVVREATYYKPAVKKYNCSDSNYFSKEFFISNDFQKNKILKTLVSFEILNFMGIKTAEFLTYYDNNSNILNVLSKEVDGKKVAELGKLPDDKIQQKEIAKIIYTADLLGFGDIANDNIISNNENLYLIDFEPFDNSRNSRFRPLDVFGKMGEENYSVAKSFDLHNTKGIIDLICQIPEFGTNTDLSLSSEDKEIIEKKYFGITLENLDKIINNTLEKFFSKVNISSEVINNFKKDFKDRQKRLFNDRENLKYQDTSDYIKSLSPKSTKSLGNFTFSNSTEILSGEPAVNNYFSDKILREEEENFNQQKIIY